MLAQRLSITQVQQQVRNQIENVEDHLRHRAARRTMKLVQNAPFWLITQRLTSPDIYQVRDQVLLALDRTAWA